MSRMIGKVLTMPERSDPTPKTCSGLKRWWSVVRLRVREWSGALANKVGLPGAVQSVDIYDDVSGQSLTVRSSPLFTRISVNGRDYYFSRISGRFDGTGTADIGGRGCPCPPTGTEEPA